MEGQPVAKKIRLALKTIIYDESIANQWLDEPPLEIWDHHIIPLLGLRDLALSRTVCTFFEAYWQEKFQGNELPMRVGNDVATIDGVMGVVEILSSRREYTKASPFVVLLAKGNHQITSSWTNPNGYVRQTTLGITRSNTKCRCNFVTICIRPTRCYLMVTFIQQNHKWTGFRIFPPTR